jgi:hypothetical protein
MNADWVVATECQGEFEEDQIRAFLEAHGIPTEVRGEALRRTHGMVMDGLGRVEILVPADHLDDVREMLDQIRSGALAIDAERDVADDPVA